MKNYSVLLTYHKGNYMADYRLTIRGVSIDDVSDYLEKDFIPNIIPAGATSLPYVKGCSYTIKDIAVSVV